MGSQEHRHRTHQLIFSCAHLVRRQFPQAWLAGVGVGALVTIATPLRCLMAGDRDIFPVLVWVVGSMFVSALALALGTWTQSGRAFEIIYFVIWFAGIYSSVRYKPQ